MYPMDVAPVDSAKALENDGIEKKAVDVTARKGGEERRREEETSFFSSSFDTTTTATETAWPTDVTPTGEAEALENKDVKEKTVGGTAGADGLFGALVTVDGGGGSSSSSSTTLNKLLS